MRFLLAGGLSVLVLQFAVPVLAEDGSGAPPADPAVATGSASTEPTAVTATASRLHYPKRVLRVRSRFTPTATPSVREVFWIARLEAARYGVSAAGLLNRIRCESTYRYWETYGPHYGLLQFMPETWGRAVASLDTRVVKYTKQRVRRARVFRVTHYSDGSRKRVGKWYVRQRVVHTYRGVLPRHPGIFHGWAQIRAGAMAMAGRSRVSNSEWACAA